MRVFLEPDGVESMSVVSHDEPSRELPRERKHRPWIHSTLFVAAPIFLIYVFIMAPAWIHDHQLAGLTDRILRHPTPPGGSGISLYGPQQVVSGDSGDCMVSVRFDLVTDRPGEEVLRHYRTANFTDGDQRYTDFEVNAWVPYGSDQAEYGYQTVIVEFDAAYQGDGSWDFRCW
ncbi:hypothetical protein ACTMTF_18580 [Nonomuraea sp. ZG12]|uniref:hypothetical protein n=1 Tax=Nonomuraea sp. ZG12 TaxID=3452207 RepID=UPI003F89B41F